MSYQLGIDLGTTYTAAAVCRSSDQRWIEPEVVNLGTRTATVPSVLFIAEDGSVVVGEAAERRALTDPDRVVREFKRRVGDPTPVVVAGRAWAAEELSARLVAWVVERVAEREGGPAARIAVTHPASWGAHKKELVAAALAGRGLAVTFLAEPQAAALHYAGTERVEAGSTIAVYDLGGGTFDAAVVRKGGPGVEGAGFGLLGRPEGLARLGGVDFDEVVFEHVRAGLPAAFEGLDEADPAVLAAVARVRRECTEAKEALSADTEVVIPVLLPGSRGSVRLHRSEFEGMIRPQVEETVAALRRAVGSAGLGPEGLSAVLLVGGSSRIPLVAQLVSEQLGRPVAVDADPKNAIAKGAALAVSPKPTVSWPGVSIPLVASPGAAGAVGTAPAAPPPGGFPESGTGGFAPAAASWGPPTYPEPQPPAQWPAPSIASSGPQPARPPVHPVPQSAGGTPATALDSSGPQPVRSPVHPDQQPAAGPSIGTSGPPTHPGSPATALMSPSGSQPARPPVQTYHATAPDWEYDDGPEKRKRRPVGLLVGTGGALAVAAVLVAALTWPSSAPAATSGTSTGSSGQIAVEAPAPTTEPAPAEQPAPAPVQPDAGMADPAPRGNTAGATTHPPARGGVAPAPAPPAPIPPAPVPSSPNSPAPVPSSPNSPAPVPSSPNPPAPVPSPSNPPAEDPSPSNPPTAENPPPSGPTNADGTPAPPVPTTPA
ncbi:Hsp70 family protein [Pseudonocardia bannensis]